MKRFLALFLSAALLLSGCAASESSSVNSGIAVSEGIDDSTAPAADNDESGADADSVDGEDNSSADSGEAPAESETESLVSEDPENNSEADSIPETKVTAESSSSDSENDSRSDSVPETRAPAESSSAASDNSVPPASESKPTVSTPKPEESTASTAAPETTPAAASADPDKVTADNPVKSSEGFYVSGTKLYDANGNEFVMRGINHPHNWFKNQDETALAAIAKTGANCVRIVCSDGQQYSKDSAETLSQLVERCKELEMIAILEVHDITGRDDLASLEKTVDYWIEVKDALIGNEAYVILNIANEWIGTWESDTWTKGYTAAIPKLRDAGIRNTIIVDAAGWGQYAKSITNGGAEVFDSDPLKNTMFSIHMYGTAGKNERVIQQNLAGVTGMGLCVIVGEFGYNHSDGDVDEAFIMQYCGENDIGYLGWSWKGNGGGVEYLDIALEWDGSALSEDWGVNLIEGDTGIRKTSKKCSVFE